MTSTDLQAVITQWDVRQAEFARILGVTPRAVTFWLSGERRIPGPVEAYIELVQWLPPSCRFLELNRRMRGATMKEWYDAS